MTISYGLFKSRFKKTIADAVYNEIISKTARYYHFLGKENAWTDFLSPFIPSQNPSVGDIPGAPTDDFRYELHVRRDILYTKLINPSDVSYVVPRINWVYGEVYDMYDDAINDDNPAASGAIRLEEAQFYVLTTDYNVYKCIYNNYGVPSTYEPTGTTTSVFTTSDGYKWKFMYAIPVSLRNRFLSSTYMPVTTALKAPFYSNGEIVSLTIDNGGSGYVNPEIVVSGDGYLEDNPYAISGIQIIKPGSGYSSAPTITFEAPSVISGNEYTATGFVELNTVLVQTTETISGGMGQFRLNYYTTPQRLEFLTPEPTIPFDTNKFTAGTHVTLTDTSGTYVVELTEDLYLGPQGWRAEFAFISGAASFAADVYSPSVIINNNPEGVETPGTSIGTATLLTSGYGYTADPIKPIITVPPPVAGATNFVFSTVVASNDILRYNDNFYRVTSAGTTGVIYPTHTTGTVSNGTAELLFVGSQAVLEPVVVETSADLDAILGPGGEIVGVIINDGGIGYTNANIQVVDSSGSGALITANFNFGNVDTLQANVELLSVVGTIDSMIVLDGGSGYGVATVEVRGDGVGCVATANVNGGKVVSIDIVNPGYGYTWTDIVIGGNGSGAIVRAIMSPIGGHGSNAVDELNANSIMFYSSISRDTIKGLNITNDYRKAGLLRNIREFGSSNRFNEDVGSGCVLITGSFDKTKLQYDQLLVQINETYKQYRIVEYTDTQILISVFNNFTILPGDTLITPEGYTIEVTNVEERTIDQFSGDFLFLTVREPFAPSDDQIVTIRTVLTV